MRTNEERIAALHARAAELEQEKREQRVRILQAVSVTVCFAAVILLALLMPGFSQTFGPGNSQGSMRASIFSESSALGYVVIGILAFLLGAAVTIFCFRLKKWQKDKGRQPGEEEGTGRIAEPDKGTGRTAEPDEGTGRTTGKGRRSPEDDTSEDDTSEDDTSEENL